MRLKQCAAALFRHADIHADILNIDHIGHGLVSRDSPQETHNIARAYYHLKSPLLT